MTTEEINQIAVAIVKKTIVDTACEPCMFATKEVSDVLNVLLQDYCIVPKKQLHDYYKSALKQSLAPSHDPRDTREIEDARSQMLVLKNLFGEEEFELNNL